MSDLIKRQDVIDFLKLIRDSECKKSMSAECKHKSVTRSKHDEHVAFCDYLIEYVKQVPTHTTPSKALGALDCVSREDLTKEIETYFGDLPIAGHYDMLALAQKLPSVQPELSNNSPELDKENGELISRQAAIDGVKTLHDVAWKNWHEPTLSANVVLDMIRELPSADRPQGKWKRRLVDNGFNADWVCSECGYRVKTDFVSFNFCPSCGCCMEEGDSDD